MATKQNDERMISFRSYEGRRSNFKYIELNLNIFQNDTTWIVLVVRISNSSHMQNTNLNCNEDEKPLLHIAPIKKHRLYLCSQCTNFLHVFIGCLTLLLRFWVIL